MTIKDKQFIFFLFILTIILSIIETVGISAIMPFISVASNPDLAETGYYKKTYELLEFKNKNDFIVVFGFALIVFYLFRGLFNIFYSYLLNRYSYGSYHHFAYKLFHGYVALPYKEFVQRNTATLTKTIVNEANNLTSIIQNVLMLLSEAFTVLFLYLILFLVNWKMTLALTTILSIKILFLTKTLSKIIKVQGEKRATMQEKFYRIISETFGNFKMIKLIGNEKKIFDSFAQASKGFSHANIINTTVASIPRNALETVGFSALIGVVVYIVYVYNNATFVIPIISMYALALYRILPAINRMMTNYNAILFLQKSLDIVHTDLMYDLEHEGDDPIGFNDRIDLRGVYFSYDGKNKILSDINLSIKKGEKVAVIGESGSGKSTLIDIIIGIYKPCEGTIMIDGKELTIHNIRLWRSKIGYIPQSIYLFDGTVADNIVFGHPFDEEKLNKILKQAKIDEFLTLKDGIHTRVGEGGIQLSGGQKQRIGIARALYNDPDILVLDEATSALDNETEAHIMDSIYEVARNKTLIIIAHRLSTIERCERKISI